MKRTYYQIFVVSVNGSDIIERDTFEEAKKEAIEWAQDTTLKPHEKVVVVKVEEEIVYEVGKVIKKSDLHFIGHLRGFSQYEVLNNPKMKLALVLESNDKYYLSYASDEEHYNSNIAHRIGAFYGDEGVSALGDLVEVID